MSFSTNTRRALAFKNVSCTNSEYGMKMWKFSC